MLKSLSIFIILINVSFIANSAPRDWKEPIYEGQVSGDINEIPVCTLNILKANGKPLEYTLSDLEDGGKELKGNFQNFYEFKINISDTDGTINISAVEMSDSISEFLQEALDAITNCSEQ